MKNTPKAVLFDLGSTLLHGSIPDIENRCRYLLELAENGSEIDATEFVTQAVELDRYAWNIRSESPFEFTTLSFIRILSDEYGLRFDREYEEIERELYFYGDDSVPTPGIITVLEELRHQGIRMAVISNHGTNSDACLIDA